MKFLSKFCITLTLIVALSSCTIDKSDDIVIPIGGCSKFTLSLDDLRTHIGEKSDEDSYPLFWSEHDQISINGVASTALTAEEAGSANAIFDFGEISLIAPYCVAYPAAAKGQVLFAESQNYTSNASFERGTAVMYGYGEKTSNIRLKHLTGILKIGIVGGATLKTAKISTIDRAPIAGAFDIDFQTGKLTPSASAAKVINYSFGDGVTLSETAPTYIHIAVPEGIYDELYITLFDVSGGVMYATVKANENKPLSAGKIREFVKNGEENYLTYREDTESFVISDFASLIEFREQVNLKTLTKDAILTNDIVIPTDEATLGSISGADYKGTLNGNGYAIKGLEHPLFHTMGGTIKGLHLEDINIVDRNNFARTLGALVNIYSGTSISHCSVSGTMRLSRNLSSENYIGGLIGQVTATSNCEIRDCVSRCEMAFDLNDTSKRKTTCIGGIVAETSSETAGVTIALKNNTNSSTIDVEGGIGKAELYIGGVIAKIGLCPETEMVQCHNKGDISVGLSIIQGIRMGGLVGRYHRNSSESGNKLSVENCSNSGNLHYSVKEEVKVYNSNSTYYNMIGGCFGQMEDSSMGAMVASNCDNSGNIEVDITPTNSRILSMVDVGGIIGNTRGQADVRDCDNRGKDMTLTMNKPSKNFSIGGLFGRIIAYADTSKPISLSNCANYSKIISNITEDLSVQSYIGGAIGYIYGYTDKSYTIELDNIDNYGSVVSMAQNYSGSISTTSTCVAGVVGAMSGGTSCEESNNKASSSQCSIVNCDNIGDTSGINIMQVSGKKSRNLYAGGVVGYANAPLAMDNCSNSMPYLYDAEVSDNGCYYGGIIAGLTHCSAGLTTTITSCRNSGEIAIKAKKSIYELAVSGFVGYLESSNAITITAQDVTNSGTITSGGEDVNFSCDILYIAGIIGKMDSNTATSYNFKNIVNLGDINVINTIINSDIETNMGGLSGGISRSNELLCPNEESYIGGIVGNLTKSLSGVKSLCNIKAYMLDRGVGAKSKGYKNIGALTGEVRADGVKLSNCYVGGTICTSAQRDAQGNIQEDITTLDADNYYNYIYGKPITAATAQSDHCVFVTE